jgi:hypothetical protein
MAWSLGDVGKIQYSMWGEFRGYSPSALDVEKRVLQAEKLEGFRSHDCVSSGENSTRWMYLLGGSKKR